VIKQCIEIEFNRINEKAIELMKLLTSNQKNKKTLTIYLPFGNILVGFLK